METESINPREEADQHNSNNNNNDEGMGRSYDCVFCKRGFNTAQALGGHMNIHRKDRAKNRPNSSKNQHNFHQGGTVYTPFLGYPPPPCDDDDDQETDQVNNCYRTYLSPVSTSSGKTRDQNVKSALNSMGEDWRMSLSLQFGHVHVEDGRKKKKKNGGREEDELDLELRLGHYP